MYNYEFRSSILCARGAQPIEVPPLQHCLPPEQQLSFKQIADPQLDRSPEIIEQIEELKQKNNDLIDLINSKERQRSIIDRKYSQLLKMYNQLKEERAFEILEERVFELQGERDILIDKINSLTRELEISEVNLDRKVKLYEDKNEQSRKLLERLNENITRKQDKLRGELEEAVNKLSAKQKEIDRLEQKNQQLGNILQQKQASLTRIVQETERNKSDTSYNIQAVETKLSQENYSLRQQIEELQSEKGQFGREHHGQQNKIKQLINEIQNLSEQNVQIKHSRDMIQYDYKQLQAKLAVGTAQLQRISNDLQHKITTIQSLNAQISNLTHQITSQNHRIQQMDLHQSTLEGQVEQSNQEIDRLKRANSELSSHISELNNRIEELSLNEITLNRDIEYQKHRVIELESINKSNADVIKDKDDVIWSLQKLLKDYKEEKLKIRNQYDKKWAEMKSLYELELEKLQNKNLEERKSSRITTNRTRSRFKENQNSRFNTQPSHFEIQ